ncbi:MAG: 50S ribosomal protein L13 [Aigarchaeota archaeon]|nr:50S ribosomal protein L13 [Aigarchaeota archaeon]MDW8092439.1 50S ribosomal protein L13 [Nitrososphaerota archaeon]
MGEGNVVVVDASNHRLGRLASRIAKLLLKGQRVVVVNAEKAVITGNRSAILDRYLVLVRRTTYASLTKVRVWYPKRPEGILRYTVVRMLPRKQAKGREALKRLRVHAGIPREYEGVKFVVFDDALHRQPVNRSGKLIKTVNLRELSSLISGKEVNR